MSRIIVADSCVELNEELQRYGNIKRANFSADLEDKHFVLDENIDIESLLNFMKESKEVIRTAAPSPESFYDAAKGYDEVFFITISSKLSATYNSANIAKEMLEEDNKDVKVHVFDSKSASTGETQIIYKLQKMFEESKTFEYIVESVEKFMAGMTTIFVLEDYDNLIKNGRMSRFAGFVASALSIRPICVAIDGEIKIKHKPRGEKRAINKIVETIGEMVDDFKERLLFITHIKNQELAELIKEKVSQVYDFKNIKIFEGSGLSSVYANRNGIILTF